MHPQCNLTLEIERLMHRHRRETSLPNKLPSTKIQISYKILIWLISFIRFFCTSRIDNISSLSCSQNNFYENSGRTLRGTVKCARGWTSVSVSILVPLFPTILTTLISRARGIPSTQHPDLWYRFFAMLHTSCRRGSRNWNVDMIMINNCQASWLDSFFCRKN